MHIILLNAVCAAAGSAPKVHELHFDARAQDDSPNNNIDLLVVDARDMDLSALNMAISWIARMRNNQTVRKAVLICPKPPIEFVVRAIRAGVNDIFERPLSGRQLFRLLAQGQTEQTTLRAARAIMSCGRLLESTEAAREPASAANILKRERQIEETQKQFAAESSRLEQLRETMHAREVDLSTRAQRIDEGFARLQNDADIAPPAAAITPAAAPQLSPEEANQFRDLEERERRFAARVDDLERRELELATRDRMLREFEAMLLSQTGAQTVPV